MKRITINRNSKNLLIWSFNWANHYTQQWSQIIDNKNKLSQEGAQGVKEKTMYNQLTIKLNSSSKLAMLKTSPTQTLPIGNIPKICRILLKFHLTDTTKHQTRYICHNQGIIIDALNLCSNVSIWIRIAMRNAGEGSMTLWAHRRDW